VSDDVLHGIGEDPNGGSPQDRRHALWLLLALFVAAVLVAGLMVLFGRGSGPNHVATPLPTGTELLGTSHSPSIANDITSTISVPPPSTPATASVNPFGATPGGDVLVAVNALRASHQLAPVAGGASLAAAACAQELGRGPACEPHYIFASAPRKVASVGVQQIQAFNATWLLDPATTRMEYGWSEGSGRFFLAILKWP
jgi:hypothetical protein